MKSPASSGLLSAFQQHSLLGSAFIAALLSVLYWGLIASDRYISEAHVIIQSTDMVSGQSLDIGSLLGS
ncbi:MAG: chain-length determining protein, partial [Methylovulum sp.]